MSSIIQVENLSKSYIISHEGREKYTTLRDVVSNKAKKIFSFPDSIQGTKLSNTKEEFWALKDINFEIEQGDRVGIIGRNGAGKSTLLKILSRITEPSSGKISIKGRVASLLEVGTGFHPELTGRENIYLNGAILGMSRAEIKRKFDEIVDFAEVEKFLDTPVKRYSSGMYVRLAFAVAAHLEPEILVVDEVLAVGDAEFQKKCLGKMEDVSKNEGRTVLFVSHNMGAIKSLCDKGIFLENGYLNSFGAINEIIQTYLHKKNSADIHGIIPNGSSTYNTGVLRFNKFKVLNSVGDDNSVYYQEDFKIFMEIFSSQVLNDVLLDIRICNNEGLEIVHACNKYEEMNNITSLIQGTNKIELTLENYLQPGNYSFTIGVSEMNGKNLDYVENILNFEVLKIGKGDNAGYAFNWDMGIVRFNSKWKVNGI